MAITERLASNYVSEVKAFFEECKKLWEEFQLDPPKPPKQKQNGGDGEPTEPTENGGDGEPTEPTENGGDEPTENGGGKMFSLTEIQQIVAKAECNSYIKYDMLSALEQMFKEREQKKLALTKQNTVGYSGRLNYKNVGKPNDCYRYFNRAFENGRNGKGDSVHLNLWCDVSGSYAHNTEETNKIIRTLALFEKSHKDFDFDVFATSVYTRKLDRKNRCIVCGGGTDILDYVPKMFRESQMPNRTNINIVLFDGGFGGKEYGKLAFDNHSTIMILDNDCKWFVQDYKSVRKIVYTAQYTAELQKNLLTALGMFFKG